MLRCPRCRRGEMFKNNPYKTLSINKMLAMHEHCPECNQKFDLEPGFWYGTGYISYGLAVLISAITFILWFFTIGVSINDNRVFYWLIANTVLLFLLQPWLMQFSRAVYIYIFVNYDPNYEKTEGTRFDY